MTDDIEAALQFYCRLNQQYFMSKKLFKHSIKIILKIVLNAPGI